jgi:two-component system response regulator YesN
LGKVFKAKTGEYFNTWLDRVRIRKAKALLERGLKVYQVAQIVGYADADYFQQKFKKHAGVTPSAWKQESRAEPKPPNPGEHHQI